MADREIVIDESSEGQRLDCYLAGLLAEHCSRSQIKKLIEEGQIKVSGREITPHYRIKAGERIEVSWGRQADPGTRAENIELDILFEDDEIIVVNKPAGMVVHPAHGNLEHTLVNALLYHVKHLSEWPDSVRPGIVHRLDKDTSGVLVVAKNEKAHRILARQFRDHTIERVYQGIVTGVVQHDEGLCEEPVGRSFLNRKRVVVRPSGGKEAQTFFKVLRRFSVNTLVEVYPKTGRTHQIRVHMAHLGHPVLGDILYGSASPLIRRHALHAKSLGFVHPRTGERVCCESKLPRDMESVLRHLESGE